MLRSLVLLVMFAPRIVIRGEFFAQSLMTPWVTSLVRFLDFLLHGVQSALCYLVDSYGSKEAVKCCNITM